MKTVSILIRTLNRPVQLADALASVAAQTYRPLEVIIVNDGGSPVEHIAERVLEGSGVGFRYHAHAQRLGRSTAANQALELATGELALFLDDDDWILPTHIEHLAALLDNDATLIAAYSDTCCYRGGKLLDEPYFARDFDANHLAVENYLPIHSVLFYRKVWEAGCRFSPHLSLYEDWHFWLQVAQQGGFQRHPEASACYRLDISGVGGEKDREYRSQYLAFLREALVILSDSQLIHLHYASRALHQAQDELDKVNDEIAHERLVSAGLQRRITELEDSRIYRLYPLELRLDRVESRIRQKTSTLKKWCSSDNWKSVAAQQSRRAQRRFSALKRKAGQVKHRLFRKANTLEMLLKSGDWRGIGERLQRYTGRMGAYLKLSRQRRLEACEPGIDILCTRHTEFVARRISASLERLGVQPVRIISDGSGAASKRLCIVVCPQMFSRLPDSYIAFQMEQTVSSRWFDDAYINRLANALAVMDYSMTNLRYLQESAGLSHKHLYYVPISNLPPGVLGSNASPAEPEYDVVFYGDANNPRRLAFLEALEQRFSLLRVSEVFGDELYAQLRRARVVVNVHYYEGALLETTRLYECLSLGLPVVSESSVDIAEHEVLKPWVRFTPIDDIAAMVDAIEAELAEQHAGKPVLEPQDDLANLHFYLTRMLVALNLVDASQLEALPLPFAPPLLEQGVGLSLPETWQRREAFLQTYPGYPVFPGLRHHQGWRGCALSYRYLARRALEAGLPRLDIREDDALLDSAAQLRWKKACALFDANDDNDILCGLVADLADDMQVLDAFTHDGEDYVVINCMTSMVCNRYGPRAIRLLAEWSFDDQAESNTIDRYLERQQIRVLIPLPFIARHRPDSQSTLWHFQNTTYDGMITTSEQRLSEAFQRSLT